MTSFEIFDMASLGMGVIEMDTKGEAVCALKQMKRDRIVIIIIM